MSSKEKGALGKIWYILRFIPPMTVLGYWIYELVRQADGNMRKVIFIAVLMAADVMGAVFIADDRNFSKGYPKRWLYIIIDALLCTGAMLLFVVTFSEAMFVLFIIVMPILLMVFKLYYLDKCEVEGRGFWGVLLTEPVLHYMMLYPLSRL